MIQRAQGCSYDAGRRRASPVNGDGRSRVACWGDGGGKRHRAAGLQGWVQPPSIIYHVAQVAHTARGPEDPARAKRACRRAGRHGKAAAQGEIRPPHQPEHGRASTSGPPRDGLDGAAVGLLGAAVRPAPHGQTATLSERFFPHPPCPCGSFADARAAITRYICWYNAERPHQALSYRSPQQDQRVLAVGHPDQPDPCGHVA